MPIGIDGSGTITGISAGGLPDGVIVADDIASSAVTPAKLSTGAPSWDSSGNLSFNSGYGSTARAFACRAWVNFNGGGTVAIRASGNVSSITDNGTGDYTVNFSTAMPDANYSVVGTTGFNTTSLRCLVLPYNQFPQGSSAVRIQMPASDGNISSDVPLACVAVFR